LLIFSSCALNRKISEH